MCCILRVLKLKTSMNSLHLLDVEAPGGPASNQPKAPGGSAKEGPHACGGRGGGGGVERLSCTCFTCPGGFGRLIRTCFTCLGGSREGQIPGTCEDGWVR